MLEDRLEQDIKSALLAGNKDRATTLRGLKAVLLNVKVAQGKRDSGLTDEEVLPILAKEAKKRQESADMYTQGQATARAEAELIEKKIIEEYLPKQLGESEVTDLLKTVINETGATDMQHLGKVIGAAKQKAGASADGSLIARLAKELLG